MTLRVHDFSPSGPSDWRLSLVAIPSSPHAHQRARRWPALQGRFWLGGRELVQPVLAEVDLHDGIVSATERTTGIFGAGESLAAALEDLRCALREHLDVQERESSLSEQLQVQRDFLRAHLRRQVA
jgi:hypothetical protein